LSCTRAIDLNVLLAQGVEHHDLVDAVDELRPELRLHLGHHRGLDGAVFGSRHALIICEPRLEVITAPCS